MVALSVDADKFVVWLYEWFICVLVRLKVTPEKLTIFLFASMVIFRPFDLNALLILCLVFLYFSGVALHAARPSSPCSPMP